MTSVTERRPPVRAGLTTLDGSWWERILTVLVTVLLTPGTSETPALTAAAATLTKRPATECSPSYRPALCTPFLYWSMSIFNAASRCLCATSVSCVRLNLRGAACTSAINSSTGRLTKASRR
ncbi:hypothetical protein PCPL58_p2017 (plasmid) [Pseudomonas cerasi]|nr:hypothetical protein PCPL58_p2017 [Pseudomonas cerasi]